MDTYKGLLIGCIWVAEPVNSEVMLITGREVLRSDVCLNGKTSSFQVHLCLLNRPQPALSSYNTAVVH